jgi:hypothetical protein
MRSLLLILITTISLAVTAQTYTVGIKSITYTDPARSNRSIPIDFRYPGTSTAVAAGQFPFVIFAHGFQMGGNDYYNYGDSLAKIGYIVGLLRTEESLSPSHPNFAQDLIFVHNKLIAENAVSSSFFFQRVLPKGAIGGHSMGAGCTVLSAQYSTPATCYFTFAAATTNPSSITAAPNLDKPYLSFAGSRDCIAPYSTNQLQHYLQAGSSCKYSINIKDGLHCQFNLAVGTCSFGEGFSGCASSPLSRAQQFNKVMSFLVPYLDYYLKGDCNAWTLFESRYNTNTVDSLIKNCNNVVPSNASISGTTTFCNGSSTTLTANPSGFNYTWTGNSTANTLNVTQGGTYGVAVGNGVCTLPTVNVTVREDFVPATPSAIAINDTVCSGISSVAVSVTNDTTSTIYNWTVPAGWNITFGNITNAIQVTTGTDGGTIEVTAENYCGTSAPSAKTVTVIPSTLGVPGVIGGPTSACGNSTSTYSVAAVSGATSYAWTLPSGWQAGTTTTNNSIDVSPTANGTDGTVSVVAQNECGNSVPTTINVTVNNPPTLTNITGPTKLCVGDQSDYALSVTHNGIVSWGNNGFQVVQGAGTTTITLAAAVAGATNVNASAQNACGASNVVLTNVTIIDTPNVTITKAGNDLIVNPSVGSTVEWYFNNQSLGLTTYTISPTQEGLYTALVTNTDGCEGWAFPFYYSISSVNNLTNGNNFTIHPNPNNTGTLMIQFNQPTQGETLTITDMTGRAVTQTKLNQQVNSVDVSTLSSGIYLARLENGSAKKLIIE